MIKIFELKPNRNPNSLTPVSRILNVDFYDEDGQSTYESYTFDANMVLAVNVESWDGFDSYNVRILMDGNTIEICPVTQDEVVKLRASIFGARIAEKLF